MKIIALLENSIADGGGFNQALNAILQMKRICENRFEFEVFTTIKNNIPVVEKLGISAVFLPINLPEKLLSLFIARPWWQILQSLIKLKTILPFEKKFIHHGADLVYFIGPSKRSLKLQMLNYMIVVWDLCHRDAPEFPEVRQFNEFSTRESFYRRALTPSIIVLADSDTLAENISGRYGVDQNKILPMPFSPAPLLKEINAIETHDVLAKYNIDHDYFFYPSHFWSHKNHIRILEALLILRREGWQPMIVFTGGDMGNLKTVGSFIKRYDLADQVKILGFVPMEDMRGLYSGCRAVVMPTYFGPTNLPPLEAWMLGKPLIYSSHLREQAGDAAILVDPDDANDLARALKTSMNDRICADLIEKGYRRLREIDGLRNMAERELLDRLIKFEKRSKCWGANIHKAASDGNEREFHAR